MKLATNLDMFLGKNKFLGPLFLSRVVSMERYCISGTWGRYQSPLDIQRY